MLASLLPGLREVRTPLAVGYLWFLNFWLWWGNHLPREVSDSDWLPVRHVLELSDLVGKTITLAAISFAAYLWGTLVVLPYHVAAGFRPAKEYPKKNDEWGLVAGRIIFSSDPQKSDFYRFWYRVNIVVVDGATAIAKVILGKAMRTFVRTTIELGAKWSKSEGETLRLFTKNRDDLGTRLLLADKELYGEYDRVMAEAQFRINVVPPLLALIITVAISADERPWWFWPVLAIATILVGILGFQGFGRDFEALTVLMRAVIVGKITAPYLPGDQDKSGAAGHGFVTSSPKNTAHGPELQPPDNIQPGRQPLP